MPPRGFKISTSQLRSKSSCSFNALCYVLNESHIMSICEVDQTENIGLRSKGRLRFLRTPLNYFITSNVKGSTLKKKNWIVN